MNSKVSSISKFFSMAEKQMLFVLLVTHCVYSQPYLQTLLFNHIVFKSFAVFNILLEEDNQYL